MSKEVFIEKKEIHGSLSAVTHVPLHALMLRPVSQAGPMHESAGVGEVS